MALLGRILGYVAAASAGASVALAQPVDLPIPAAQTATFPAGISVRKLPGGSVYVDAHGRTLYGMDMRTVLRWAPDPARYCESHCAGWEPLLAPPGSAPNIAFPASRRERPSSDAGKMVSPEKAPDWTIIQGPQGSQYVYKGWHMVYTHAGDRPGSTAHEGEQAMTWNTLKFVPPVPALTAPDIVSAQFVDGAYLLTDKSGHLLFTGKCAPDCAQWEPLAAGLVNRGVGAWTVVRTGEQPQWQYRGKSVFVSRSAEISDLPAHATTLRP